MVADSDAMARKYLNDDSMPYLGDLMHETSLMLVNTHYSLSGSKAFPPTVVEIGGVHIREPKPLDEVRDVAASILPIDRFKRSNPLE